MKRMVAVCAVASMTAALFAYNPPAGGQSLFNLSSPTQLTSASSAAGGGIFMPGPDSIAFNPALPSYEDRVQLDADFSVLGNTGDGESGAAFQTGILIPLKMFNVSGVLNGVFVDGDGVFVDGDAKQDEMRLGNSLNFKAGISKEVTERICVGVNLDAGYLWGVKDYKGNTKDWSLGAGLGALYRRESLGFTKDFRVGAALLNLGKYYSVDLVGIKKGDDVADTFPALATLKMGAGANLLTTKDFVLGASFDMTIPSFQDVVFSFGANFAVKDIFFINVAENIDVAEASEGFGDFMPAISLSVKFSLDAKNNSYLKAHSWENSEMLASAAWQQRYSDVQVVSAGLRIKLGQQDVEPPVIQIWDEE